MRKIVVHEFLTLDGVLQAPGDSKEDLEEGFPYGGWTHPYWHDDIGVHFGQAFAEADAVLLGRKTWQGHGAAFGPHPDQDPFGGMTKYVVSNMSLQSTTTNEIPAETVEVANAAFPLRNTCMRLREELGVIFNDQQFEGLYPTRRQPAETPWRLAVAILLQFMENLTDRQAAEAVRGRIDWKYLLGLPPKMLDLITRF
jgi:hypothetical protein